MVFEFLNWRSSFETHRRGVKRGELTYRRPRPFFDLTRKMEWFKFLVLVFFGSWIAGLVGVFAYFAVSAAAGYLVWEPIDWVWLFVICWLVFWFLHLIHSLRFYRIARLTDVDFIPLDKALGIGKRILTMPEDLSPTDYNILYSRYIWADVECEPYRDVEDWVARIGQVQSGGPAVTTGGGDFASSIGEGIGAAIGLKYSESKIREIVEMSGGIPSTREIVKILQTELVPKCREKLGDRLMRLYLVFLMTQPPVLPFDKSTSRGEMRRVASVSDTKDVLDYLSGFAQKNGGGTMIGVWKLKSSRKPTDLGDYDLDTTVEHWKSESTGRIASIEKVRKTPRGPLVSEYVFEVDKLEKIQNRPSDPFDKEWWADLTKEIDRDTNYRRLRKRAVKWFKEHE